MRLLQPEESLKDLQLGTTTASPPSEALLSQSQDQSQSCKIEQVGVSQIISKVSTFCSDFQSTTVKQEETQTPEQILLKLRKKVCRKILQILTKELNLGMMDSQDLAIKFETTIFNAFSNDSVQYLLAVKTVCNRVRVSPVYSRQNLYLLPSCKTFQKHLSTL